ncbi:hypothetical protein C0Q70_19423 [Pomacea canaliculata]|uniref:Amino acid permease/ SLC12A domain-containing protein n=1 Tax=Pomacea canaliculata TaxID=400727 RepID=A0A2T7NJA1_POMCA|nr:hypothetical protein C0Q70_19423 [Pomacea canaliculata]
MDSLDLPKGGQGPPAPDNKDSKLTLKQNFGFIRGTSLVIGSVIGALTYAELNSVVSKSGLTYAYLHDCYGRLPAFLFLWTSATVIVPSMIAISGLAFADYLLTLAPVCGPRPELIVKLCAVAMIVTLMVINCKSNDVAAPVQVICTILKILALLVIVFGGIIRMAQGWTAELRQGFDNSTKESVNIALAFYSINYSYAGWSNVFTIFEEVKNPKRNLLACSGVGILVVTVLYIMANISFLTVLSRKEMMTSSAVAVDWADVVLGSASITMLLAIAVSTFGAAASSLFTGSRIIFAAGRDNVMPEWLSFLHVNNLSPVPAILFTGILAIIFVIPGGIGNIINFLMFPMNILDFLSTTVLFVFRKTKPNAPRIIKNEDDAFKISDIFA